MTVEFEPVMEKLIRIAQWSTGRLISVLNRVHERAQAQGLTQVVAHVERALAHLEQTLVLEQAWQQRGRGQYTQEVADIDAIVDALLVGFRDIAVGHKRGLPLGDPLPERIDGMLEDVFPGGVGTLVRMPFIDQIAAVEQVIDKLQTEHAALIDELSLTRRLQLLAERAVEYRAAVDVGTNRVEYSTVRAAQQRGHRFLLEVVCMILGTYADGDNSDHLTFRGELLAPVIEQMEVVRSLRRSRRANTDETADTPDELPDELSDELQLPGEPAEAALSAAVAMTA